MDKPTQHERWARFRFAVIGPLLADPPAKGQLMHALQALAERQCKHPVTGDYVSFSAATLERWYYRARSTDDPMTALRRQRRTDASHSRVLIPPLPELVHAQYQQHPGWSVQLHYDNLKALLELHSDLPALPSYATVRRHFKARGYTRQRPSRRRAGNNNDKHHQPRETRSYELAQVNALWHLDFHHGRQRVLSTHGNWIKPILLCVIDDHSRLICHLQWYTDETTQSLVHGFCQALQKRALPRALMSDNGAAMMAEEFTNGLNTLGIVHETTLPYSPEQNGKQETLWASVEGRLMAMLEQLEDLTLEQLNDFSWIWAEYDYNQRLHSQLATTPIERFLNAEDIGRSCPDSQTLKQAFCCTTTRKQRRSDGTVSLGGKRFELPAQYRHLQSVRLRYARWDLRFVELLDPHQNTPLCRVYPLDKHANAHTRRKPLTPVDSVSNPLAVPGIKQSQPHHTVADLISADLPPLMQKLLGEFAATGRPPAWLSKPTQPDKSTQPKESSS